MNADILLAGAIVVHRDRILIVRRSKKETFLPRVWGVPCGKIDHGESPSEAVLRELREETGLRGEVVRCVGQQTFCSYRKGRMLNNMQHNYLIRLPGSDGASPAVTLPERDQASQWVHYQDLDKAGLDDHNLTAIRQALAVTSSP